MHNNHTPPTTEDKRVATVTAALALLGIELEPMHDGTYLAHRFDMSRPLQDLAAAEAFAAAAMDRIR